MSEPLEAKEATGSVAAQDRRLLIALVGVLVVVFALVGSNVAANHSPKPHHVPVGVVGTPPIVRSVSAVIGQRAPGAYQIHAYASLVDARTAILHRAVYGAFRPAPSPVLLVASAASPTVAALLQQTVAAATHARGQALVVRDLVPLPSSDSRGATAFSMILSLLITGVSAWSPPAGAPAPRGHGCPGNRRGARGGLRHERRDRRVPRPLPRGLGVATLFYLALGLPIAAFQVLVGAGGVAIGAVMFLVIGNPASGGSSAPELLPGFWRALSQVLPPGAAITAVRDVVYFHGHGMTNAIIVLSIWAVVGAVVAIVVNVLRAGTRVASASG